MVPTVMKISIVILMTLLYITTSAKSIGQYEKVNPSELDFIPDDGSLDTALINYLFSRQMVNRLRNNLDISDLQRKRSYWKQCAFNAVSCFGRK